MSPWRRRLRALLEHRMDRGEVSQTVADPLLALGYTKTSIALRVLALRRAAEIPATHGNVQVLVESSDLALESRDGEISLGLRLSFMTANHRRLTSRSRSADFDTTSGLKLVAAGAIDTIRADITLRVPSRRAFNGSRRWLPWQSCLA